MQYVIARTDSEFVGGDALIAPFPDIDGIVAGRCGHRPLRVLKNETLLSITAKNRRRRCVPFLLPVNRNLQRPDVHSPEAAVDPLRRNVSLQAHGQILDFR